MGSRSRSFDRRFRQLAASFLLPSVVSAPVRAETTTSGEPADLFVLRTPSSPAFVALGVSPTEVQRPTTPAAFASDLVSAFRGEDNSLVLPQGFALEVAPYWLTPRYDLSFREYAEEGWESFYRNATLSIATTGTPAAAASDGDAGDMAAMAAPGTDLAVGFRTTLFHPGLDGEQNKCVTLIQEQLDEEARVDTLELHKRAHEQAAAEWASQHSGNPPPVKVTKPAFDRPAVAPTAPPPPDDKSPTFAQEYKQYLLEDIKYRKALEEHNAQVAAWAKYDAAGDLEAFNDLLRKAVEAVKAEMEKRADADKVAALRPDYEKCVQRITAHQSGISVDAASAAVWSFPSTRFENGDFKRGMVWVTGSWSNDNGSAVLLARYVGSEDVDDELESVFDLGGRVIYAADRFGISVEAIGRKGDAWASRYAGTFDFRVVGTTWVTLTIGKDYGKGSEGGLIANAALQFNVGEPIDKLKPLAEQVK